LSPVAKKKRKTRQKLPILAIFGRKLRKRREDLGLTQGQIVAYMHRMNEDLDGFTRPQLSNYEAGKVASPDPIVMLFLCKKYGMKVDEVLQELADERQDLRHKLGETHPDRESKPA
jgi:transcriptional regulator with XRE-family HTH domain